MQSHQKWSTVVSSDASTLTESLPAVSLPGLPVKIPAQVYFCISSVLKQRLLFCTNTNLWVSQWVVSDFISLNIAVSLCAAYLSLPVMGLLKTTVGVAPTPAQPSKPGELKFALALTGALLVMVCKSLNFCSAQRQESL